MWSDTDSNGIGVCRTLLEFKSCDSRRSVSKRVWAFVRETQLFDPSPIIFSLDRLAISRDGSTLGVDIGHPALDCDFDLSDSHLGDRHLGRHVDCDLGQLGDDSPIDRQPSGSLCCDELGDRPRRSAQGILACDRNGTRWAFET